MAALLSVVRPAPEIDKFWSISLPWSNGVTRSSLPGWRSIKLCDSHGRSFLEPGRKQNDCKIASNVTKHGVSASSSQAAQHYSLAPLVSALKTAAEENAASFHFPGHNRGRAAPSPLVELIGRRPFLHDLPELPELDNLFSPEGPIRDAQKQAAQLFGASETWFLVGGTTCGIQAAIMATCSPGDSLILPRNSHISATSALVLTGVSPKYIIPDYDSDWDIASAVTPTQVEKAINDLELEGRKAAAVFVTSPTYHGICSNLKEISTVCHSRNIPLIVDEAHGAHFGFHPQLPISALQQGADLTVQSTHKVLCSLTQSSMLHRSGKLVDRERICRCLQTLQSTSPSYLLLASLDAATAQLSKNPEKFFNNAIHLANEARSLIKQIVGVSVLDFPSFSKFPAIDPLRVNISIWQLGLSGYEADEFLFKDQNVVSEVVGSHSITFVFTPGTCRDHVHRLLLGLEHLSSSLPLGSERRIGKRTEQKDPEPFLDITIELSPRDAFFTRKRKIDIKESVGKICGELICPYPPGIPVMIPGEIITAKSLEYLLQIRSKGGVISGAADPLLSSIVICDVQDVISGL
ncbi:hypothetical protein Ancab_002478 [Ancistrocladus abbreviatus]